MRTKIMIVLFAVLFVTGTIFAGEKANKAEKSAYNYVSTWYGPIDPGTITVSGKTVHYRGMINRFYYSASDERLSGWVTTVLNGNYDLTGSGEIWGTFQIGDANAGWDGFWHGQQYNYSFGKLNWIVKFVGRGTGAYEGLKTEYNEAFDTLVDPSFSPWSGYGVGEITNVNKD
jgi:hypothetical protein